MKEINKIIIHCSATPEGRDVSIDTIRKWHTDKGWRDIGYNYVIELDGSIRKGRSKQISGAHTRGHNSTSIGICYVGGMDSKMINAKDTRTPEQIDSLRDLLIHLSIKYPNATLHGHNEFAAKACPSFDVQDIYSWYNLKEEYRCR